MLTTSDRIWFGPIRSDLIETYQRWLNNIEVIRSLAVPVRPMTIEAEQDWLDQAVADHFELSELHALIRPPSKQSR